MESHTVPVMTPETNTTTMLEDACCLGPTSPYLDNLLIVKDIQEPKLACSGIRRAGHFSVPKAQERFTGSDLSREFYTASLSSSIFTLISFFNSTKENRWGSGRQ